MADGTVRKMLRGATVRGTNRDRNAVPSPEDTRLEFEDCWLDPPRFRKAINTYEKELEGTHKALKNIIKHIDEMVSKGNEFVASQEKVNGSIRQIEQNIGQIGTMTSDERELKESISSFANKLDDFKDGFSNVLSQIDTTIKKQLKQFDETECRNNFKEQRKQFIESSKKYYSSMQSGLQLGEKKIEKIEAAETSSSDSRNEFHEKSLAYVKTLLSIEEKKKYVLPETFLLYTQRWTLFLRDTNEKMKAYEEPDGIIEKQLNDSRDKHEGSMQMIENLMTRHKRNPVEMMKTNDNVHEGHVLMMEKGMANRMGQRMGQLGTKWVHRYLHYNISKKEITLTPFDDNIYKSTKYKLISGLPKIPDNPVVIDRRFTFDIPVENYKSKTEEEQRMFNFQASDKNEYQQWRVKLGSNVSGNARVFKTGTPGQLGHITLNLDVTDHIIERVQTAITYVESNGGLSAEGVYRLVGVQSKVDELIAKLVSNNDIDWEVQDLRTITSAIKGLFRNFSKPLMTFDLHERFIGCIKHQQMTLEQRIDNLKQLVQDLPDKNQQLLKVITQHLMKIAAKEKENKMSATNLSVCFGPVFMWKEEESCEAIFDVRFQCSVIEHLIENYTEIFLDDNEDTKKINTDLRESKYSLSKRTISRSSMHRSSSLHSSTQSRDSKCRSTYDNYGPVIETSEPSISSSNEFLESEPPLTSINESKTDLDQISSSSNDNIKPISSSISSKPSIQSTSHVRVDSESSESEKDEIIISGTSGQLHQTSSSNNSSEIKRSKLKNKSSSIVRRPTGNKISDFEPVREEKPKARTRATAIYACTADQDDELTFEKGQIFYDVNTFAENDGWYRATMDINGIPKSGLVPGPFIKFISEED